MMVAKWSSCATYNRHTAAIATHCVLATQKCLITWYMLSPYLCSALYVSVFNLCMLDGSRDNLLCIFSLSCRCWKLVSFDSSIITAYTGVITSTYCHYRGSSLQSVVWVGLAITLIGWYDNRN